MEHEADPAASGDPDGDAGPLTVGSEAFETLRPEWERLWRATPAASPFQHAAFVGCWLRHFGAGVEPCFLAFRRGGELIGVLPLDLAGPTPVQLGDANVQDYGGLLAVRGDEAECAGLLLEWLREDFSPGIELWGLPEGDPFAAELAGMAGDRGWACEVEPEAVAPVTALPGEFEAYVAGLGKHDRHELRRKLRALEAAGTVAFELSPEEGTGAWVAGLLEMMEASHEGKGAFLTEPMRAFFRDLAHTFAAEGWLRAGTLSLDGQPLARTFAFRAGATVYLYNSGFDPAGAPLAAGLLSKALAIRSAIDEGATRFDFLRGSEEYKKRLGGQSRAVNRLALRRLA